MELDKIKFTFKVWKDLKKADINADNLEEKLNDYDSMVKVLTIITGDKKADVEKSIEELTQGEIINALVEAYVDSLPEKAQLQYKAQMEMLKDSLPEMMKQIDINKILDENSK